MHNLRSFIGLFLLFLCLMGCQGAQEKPFVQPADWQQRTTVEQLQYLCDQHGNWHGEISGERAMASLDVVSFSPPVLVMSRTYLVGTGANSKNYSHTYTVDLRQVRMQVAGSYDGGFTGPKSRGGVTLTATTKDARFPMDIRYLPGTAVVRTDKVQTLSLAFTPEEVNNLAYDCLQKLQQQATGGQPSG